MFPQKIKSITESNEEPLVLIKPSLIKREHALSMPQQAPGAAGGGGPPRPEAIDGPRACGLREAGVACRGASFLPTAPGRAEGR